MVAAERLATLGFLHSPIDNAPDYPLAGVMNELKPSRRYASVSIPSARISSGDAWSIFEAVTGDPAELARDVVTNGPQKALTSCPIQEFGDLLVFERAEQESFRSVVDAVQERLDSSTDQPTSIGLLGLAGSGKKYTATHLANYIGSERRTHQMTYNARLLRLEDLTAACHSIRDSTATGALTVVHFQNFEAILQPGNPLLGDFLGIMRDGQFTDKGHVRRLGAPLMFFVVNQDPVSLAPVPTPITPTANDARGIPAVDETLLLDHLHGLVRIMGPNQTSAQDKTFSVRRAMMLRQLIRQKHPHLEVNGLMKVDEAVLHALLLVPSYKHGLRSLDKIISTSRLSGRTKFDVSALPPEEQIQLHVDGRTFMSYLRSPKLPPALRERLAEGLFETYKQRRMDMAQSADEREAIQRERSMRDWDELAPELKESTRAQADDIPRKLRAVRCFMLEADRTEPLIRVPEFSTPDLDILSEMEHERFNAERLQRQWRMGPRNSKQRTTPFLVPWRDLTQEWKDVDRVMVECVPRILAKNGWKIYRMREEESEA